VGAVRKRCFPTVRSCPHPRHRHCELIAPLAGTDDHANGIAGGISKFVPLPLALFLMMTWPPGYEVIKLDFAAQTKSNRRKRRQRSCPTLAF
jgi:hypothetical protein